MNTHPRRRFRCLFCDGVFVATLTDPWLLRSFCPRCRALYIAAAEAWRLHGLWLMAWCRLDPELPHCVVVPDALPERRAA